MSFRPPLATWRQSLHTLSPVNQVQHFYTKNRGLSVRLSGTKDIILHRETHQHNFARNNSHNPHFNEMNPLDRNHDGKVNLKDLTGQPGMQQQGLMGQQGLAGQRTNPLDKNHDGKVDLKDLTGQPGYGQQGLAGQPMMGQQGLAGGAHHNPLDRNHDGKVDLKDLTGRPGMQQGLAGQPMMGQQGLVGGAHHNPLDRNHDGRVDARDFAGQSGMQQGAYIQSTQRASLTRAEPTVIETIQKDV
ncbi:hypothetical protein PROFUN_14468, partial [Planoprotostelium fungivorum]